MASKVIKQVEYYDPIYIDGRFDTKGRPTGDSEGILLCRRFMVIETKSGLRSLKRETFTETIRGDTDSKFTESLRQVVKGRYELEKKYSDHPLLIRQFTPPQLKPYLERTIKYAK